MKFQLNVGVKRWGQLLLHSFVHDACRFAASASLRPYFSFVAKGDRGLKKMIWMRE